MLEKASKIKPLATDIHGQSLIEFLIGIPILALLALGLFWVFQDCLTRWSCEKRVFLAARTAVNRRDAGFPFDPINGVFLRSLPNGVEAWVACKNGKRISARLAYLGESREGK